MNSFSDTAIENIRVPSGVTSIGEGAFFGDRDAVIRIPSTLKSDIGIIASVEETSYNDRYKSIFRMNDHVIECEDPSGRILCRVPMITDGTERHIRAMRQIWEEGPYTDPSMVDSFFDVLTTDTSRAKTALFRLSEPEKLNEVYRVKYTECLRELWERALDICIDRKDALMAKTLCDSGALDGKDISSQTEKASRRGLGDISALLMDVSGRSGHDTYLEDMEL